jgi:hypothetical protein
LLQAFAADPRQAGTGVWPQINGEKRESSRQFCKSAEGTYLGNFYFL